MQSKRGWWRAALAIGVLSAGLLPTLMSGPIAGAAQQTKQSYVVVLKDTVSRASTVADEERRNGDDVNFMRQSVIVSRHMISAAGKSQCS